MSDEPTKFEIWMQNGLPEWILPDNDYLRYDLHAVLFVLDEHLKERYGVVPR